MQSINDDEKAAEELLFVKAVVQGLADIHEGNTVTLDEAKKYWVCEVTLDQGQIEFRHITICQLI